MSEKISVLMTSYNASNFIKDSIISIMRQSYKNWELVIVDDCSNDNSVKIIKRFKEKRIKLFTLNKHIGRTKALNYGLKRVRGKYIAILDADDVAINSRLKKQINFLKKNKTFSLVGSWVEHIDRKNKSLKLVKISIDQKKIKELMISSNIFAHSSIMFNKNLIKSIGNYPTKYIYMQDYAFILKAMKKHSITIMPEYLTKIRITKTSMTHTVPAKQILNEKRFLLSYTWNNFEKKKFSKFFWIVEFLKIKIKNLML